MGAFTQKAKVQFALKCQKFARFQRRKPCKSGFKQIFLTYNYAKQVNATRNKVCKVCKQQMQLFFKLVAQVAVFFNGVSKGQCVQIFVPCNFALFRQECSQVFERACFQQPYYDKRCCEICYLLPKIGNFTKKIAKKYLKPLTVFGD